jgi:hydrogenase nickel incorporation protein HypA/HybF
VHELSVCQALLTQVAAIAEAHGALLVECITIEIGPLSGTEPTLLLNAFYTMRTGPASAATLLIEHCVVRVNCLECGSRSETPANRLVCGQCGGWRTRVIAGDELRLMSVKLCMPASPDVRGISGTVEQIGYV